MRKTEELISDVGRLALKSNLKPSTAFFLGASSLVAVALIERYSPKMTRFVSGLMKQIQSIQIPVVPVPVQHVPCRVVAEPLSDHEIGRRAGASQVVRAIARGSGN